MRNVRSLLYIQFLQLQLISTFKKSSSGKKSLIILGLSFLLIFFAPLSLISIIAPVFILSESGLATNIPAMSVAMTSIALFFLTVIRARLLFSEKDWSLLASLPIPTWQIVCSKFLFLYLLLFAINTLIMLPQAIFLQFIQPVMIATSFFFILFIMFITPLIPLVLGALFSLALAQLTNRFHKIDTRQVYILIFSLFNIGVVFFQSRVALSNNDYTTEASKMAVLNALDNVIKAYLPSWLLLPEFIPSFYLGGSLFILLSLSLFIGFVYFISKNYSQINSYITKKSIIVKKETTMQQHTPLQALIRKEFISLGQFPTLLMNLGFSYLFVVLLCGSLLFRNLATIIESFIESFQIGMDFSSYPFYAYIMGFLILTLSVYAASSLSLEGKHVWIIQTLPLSFQTIFRAKLITSLIMQIIPIILFTIILLAKGLLPISQTFAITLWLLCYAFFTSVGNIFLNFILPKYNWKSEVQVVKQSAASFWGTTGNLVLLLAFTFISVIPRFATAVDSIFILEIIFFALVATVLFAWLSRQQLYIKSKV